MTATTNKTTIRTGTVLGNGYDHGPVETISYTPSGFPECYNVRVGARLVAVRPAMISVSGPWKVLDDGGYVYSKAEPVRAYRE